MLKITDIQDHSMLYPLLIMKIKSNDIRKSNEDKVHKHYPMINFRKHVYIEEGSNPMVGLGKCNSSPITIQVLYTNNPFVF